MDGKSIGVAVIGGGGHVGLPLSIMLAKKGFSVFAVDNDVDKVEMLKRGVYPFMEEGGQELLNEVKDNNLFFCTEHRIVEKCDVVILTVGTPVDEHLNPDVSTIYTAIDEIRQYLHDGQVIVLRSTLFPGTSEKVLAFLQAEGLDVGVSYCPERIAQGTALKEMREFPQLISGSDSRSLDVARRIFSSFAPEVIELHIKEAELAKLFTNVWRYIKFSIANQFYMIAEEKGQNFYRIYDAITRNYPRTLDFPTAGFAAGPCLFKDTMQLAAYNRHNFVLGHAAMLVNETLPDFLVEQVKREYSLSGLRVGILGMAFKADNDDSRESLAYKLRKLLQYENAVVMCTDPYIKCPSFYPLETVLDSCKLIFIGCPHSIYRNFNFQGRKVIDCWGFTHSNNGE